MFSLLLEFSGGVSAFIVGFDFLSHPVVCLVIVNPDLPPRPESLFSRQLLVENMKYTGGSPFFIEFPFVLEGLILGLVGSGLAVTLLAVLVNAIGNAIPVVANNRSGLGLMLAGVVALVTVLSAYFSYRTVRRFLTVKNFEQE